MSDPSCLVRSLLARIVDVPRGQSMQLIQVASTSELYENYLLILQGLKIDYLKNEVWKVSILVP
jgi:hypothetical protein